jgi:2',3'-cyclic-nucleotide 2'-phosphodiesterase/3'-nucleotidase
MRKVLIALLIALSLTPIWAQNAGLDAAFKDVAGSYTTVKGDTLQKVAQKQFGDTHLWPVLYYVNRGPVFAPDSLNVGTVLTISKLPFKAPKYSDGDKALISAAYLATYAKFTELGVAYADKRQALLMEGLAFDKALFSDPPSVILDEDLRWYAKKTGKAYVAAKAPIVLTFLETSDIHGSIFPYNFITAKPAATSLAQVATIIGKERAANPNGTVLLDNGDALQGQPVVYYSNFLKTDAPHIWSQVTNYLGYDVVGVGNHDIEAGHLVYDKLYKEMKAPVTCANAVKDDGNTYFAPYVVIQRQGLKIAILGMVEPKLTEQLPPQFWSGMNFADMIQTAKKWVPIIQQKEKPDLIIGLFHSGVDYSYGGQDANTVANENAAELVAQQVPGFDFLLVGHDHSGWDGQGWDVAAKKKVDVKDSNGKIVPIYGPVNAAANVAKVNVTYTWDRASKSYVKSVAGGLVPVAGVPADSAFTAQFQPFYDEVKNWVNQPVGKLAGTITTRDSMFGDSPFVDLIHNIQLKLSSDPSTGLKPAQISLAAPLTLDATIPSSADGTMYVRDMFTLYQFENYLYTMDLSGQQIKDFLEYSYKGWVDTMPNSGNHIISFTKTPDGKLIQDARTGAYKTNTAYYNYDSAAGINYTVDLSKPAGQRVAIASMADGSAFDLAKTYSVAINSYRASGGGGHLTTGIGLDPKALKAFKYVTGSTTKDLRFYLLSWFKQQSGAVTVNANGNWSFIPADLAAQGKASDYPLLYPTPAAK